jgi:hypothetical protein
MKATSHYSVDFFKGSESFKPVESAPKSRFNALLKRVQSFLTTNTTEPKVRQKRDRVGQSYWHTFDPITGQTNYFETETEVRQWLEGRYYQ